MGRFIRWCLESLDIIEHWETAKKIWLYLAFTVGPAMITGFAGLSWGHIFMMGVAGLLLLVGLLNIPRMPWAQDISHGRQWREARERVLAKLKDRRLVGDITLPLRDVATIWYGSDNLTNIIERLEWNTKFRLLKRAVNAGRVRAINLNPSGQAFMQTSGDISDLIQYFESGRM